MQTIFRKAIATDVPQIWNILKDAILRRKNEGSNQWQDGYPNVHSIETDIERGSGFVLVKDEIIVGYIALLINDEQAYQHIDGKWLREGDFVVFHRIAVSEADLSRGFAKKMMEQAEEFARQHQIKSVRADTNFDNFAMLHLFEKLGYHYCGEVLMRNSPRRAYEKVIGKASV